jgi:hypothetical protein
VQTSSSSLYLLIGLLGALVGLGLLHLRTVRRLRQFTGLLRHAGSGHWAVRVPVCGTRQISKLATTVNQLLAHITELEVRQIESQRDFDALENANLELKRNILELSVPRAPQGPLEVAVPPPKTVVVSLTADPLAGVSSGKHLFESLDKEIGRALRFGN